ncbi:MAG: 50S ribosome-binding GTPase [Phycisphaerae bacterium]|nr:50S ribosome-binding GTPase [Phycisphaerae bacterium]
MPANLTPEYEHAEERLRQAADDAERLEALREMLSTIPKHKGTEKMQADIKRRISQVTKAAAKKTQVRGVDPFHVPRGGAGQIVLVGPPNVGKSHLLATTTHAAVKVANYPFTTTVPAPGMWNYQDVQLELVDTPPVTAGQIPPGLLGTIRAADIIAIVVDAADQPLEQAEMVLNLLGERGLALVSVPRAALAGDPARYSGLVIANKIDLADRSAIAAMGELYAGRVEVHPVSAASGEGLDGLARRLWQLLALVRVYTKEPGRPPDHDRPFTLPAGATVEDLAREIHRELPTTMRFARIWGDGRFSGQQVHRNDVLHDKDTVEIHQ